MNILLNPIALLLTAVAAGTVPLAAVEHDHDHGEAHGHGPLTAAGTIVIGGDRVTAGIGLVAPGAEAVVELELTPATAPAAVRLWIGIASGRGSVKARAEAETGHAGAYHAHVPVPSPLPADAALWIAIEGGDGAIARGSLPLPSAK